MKTPRTALILISASFLASFTLNAQDAASPADASDRRIPVYEVPRGARDPFFPPARGDGDQTDEVGAEVTPDAVREVINLTAIMGAQSRDGKVILNGKIYNVGETFTIEMQGRPVIFRVMDVTVKPAGVVLGFDEQRITVPLIKGANGE